MPSDQQDHGGTVVIQPPFPRSKPVRVGPDQFLLVIQQARPDTATGRGGITLFIDGVEQPTPAQRLWLQQVAERLAMHLEFNIGNNRPDLLIAYALSDSGGSGVDWTVTRSAAAPTTHRPWEHDLATINMVLMGAVDAHLRAPGELARLLAEYRLVPVCVLHDQRVLRLPRGGTADPHDEVGVVVNTATSAD